MLEINQLFKDLAKELQEANQVDNTKEILNKQIILNDLNNNVLTLKCRHDAMLYTIGELIWYWSGRNDIEFIDHFSKFWKNISDDGKTANSAYGYIIKYKHGFDQLECVIDELRRHPDSRRGIINLNTPSMYRMVTRDTQCTIFLQYYIRNNKLCSTAVMRSNDFIKGLTFDITYFTELQKYVANRLGLECGPYTHIDVSFHTYDSDKELLNKIANETEEVDVIYNLDLLWDKKYLDMMIDKIMNHWVDKKDFELFCIQNQLIEYDSNKIFSNQV